MNSFQKNYRGFFLSLLFLVLFAFQAQPRLLRAEENYRVSDAVGADTEDEVSTSDSSTAPDAVQADNEFSDGFKKVGRGIKKGALVTGHAFKKAGLAIKNYFTGTSSASVEERDLGSQEREGSSAPELRDNGYNSDLDRVGNSPKS